MAWVCGLRLTPCPWVSACVCGWLGATDPNSNEAVSSEQTNDMYSLSGAGVVLAS